MKYLLLIFLFSCRNDHRCDESLYIDKWNESEQRLRIFKNDSNAMKAAINEMRTDTSFVLVGSMRFSIAKLPTEVTWRNDSIIITPAIPPQKPFTNDK